MTTGYDKTICRMPREERFVAARAYLGHEVIVRASSIRSAASAEYYPGRVHAVAWGYEGANDVLILVLSGPKGVGMPMIALNLTTILSFLPETPDEEEAPDA